MYEFDLNIVRKSLYTKKIYLCGFAKSFYAEFHAVLDFELGFTGGNMSVMNIDGLEPLEFRNLSEIGGGYRADNEHMIITCGTSAENDELYREAGYIYGETWIKKVEAIEILRRKTNVSVFGCCCSRDTMSLHNDIGYKVDRYIFSVSPISAVSAKHIEKNLTEDELSNICSGYKSLSGILRRGICMDLNKTCFNYLNDKHSDYILIDMGSMRFDVFKLYNNGHESLVTKNIPDTLLFEELMNSLHILNRNRINVNNLQDDSMESYLDMFIEKLKLLYEEDKIVLIELKAESLRIYPNEVLKEECGRNFTIKFNTILDKSFKYIKRKLPNAHVIEFPDVIVTDSEFPRMAATLHYVMEWYDYAYRCLNIITKCSLPLEEEKGILEQLRQDYNKKIWKRIRTAINRTIT